MRNENIKHDVEWLPSAYSYKHTQIKFTHISIYTYIHLHQGHQVGGRVYPNCVGGVPTLIYIHKWGVRIWTFTNNLMIIIVKPTLANNKHVSELSQHPRIIGNSLKNYWKNNLKIIITRSIVFTMIYQNAVWLNSKYHVHFKYRSPISPTSTK